MKKTISDIVNNEYKEFGRYVCYERAIPHLIDGFKICQRKAFYCCKSHQKFVKVMALSGELISKGNYHHGDSSASAAISAMAQDFPGSNNLPVFLKDGSFGNKFVTKPSAPRYIYVKPNKLYYDLYKDSFLHQSSDDLDDPEPKFYLPVIPTILLNGIKGIAVGFATEILPYDIVDIIGTVKSMVDFDHTPEDLHSFPPYFEGYTGEIKFNEEDQKYVLYGDYEIINTTTIQINEIPINFDREKYIKHLNKLIDKGLIKSFIDNSKKYWNIKIKLARNSKVFDDPITYLKLKYVLNENLTVVDQNNQIKVFSNVLEIIYEFTKFRLDIYKQRREFMMNKLKEDTLYNTSKIKFIKLMCAINFKKMTKKDIEELVLSKGCRKDHLKKHMEIQVHRLNLDEIEKTKIKIEELIKEFRWYKKITPKELYLIDIKELEDKFLED